MTEHRIIAKPATVRTSSLRGSVARLVEPSTTTPEALLDKIREHLRVGDLLAARDLSNKAVAKWPENNELQKIKKVLADGKSFSIPEKSGPSRHEELQWIKNPPEQYQGKWVALLGSKVIGSARTLKELLSTLPSDLAHPPLTVKIAS